MSEDLLKQISSFFLLPVDYLAPQQRKILTPAIVQDLELHELLVSANDDSLPLHTTVASSNHNPAARAVEKMFVSRYTNSHSFLRDTQHLLDRHKPSSSSSTSSSYETYLATWQEIRVEHGFKEKYFFVEWDRFDMLNHHATFLQCLSAYNLFSPILTLLLPIIILLIPFAVLHMRGVPITIADYMDVLKLVASNNAIGKLFLTNFASISMKDRMYVLSSAIFYLFSIYQNFMVAKRYHSNLRNIQHHFRVLQQYATETLARMDQWMVSSQSLRSYRPFTERVLQERSQMKQLLSRLQPFCGFRSDFEMFGHMGGMLQLWYELHQLPSWHETILYGLGFHGYLDLLEGVQGRLRSGHLSFAKLLPKTRDNNKKKKEKEKLLKREKHQKTQTKLDKWFMKQAYYPCLLGKEPVKNKLSLAKNMILTGPNASGKTTILKTVLANVILTQQWGCGCYGAASLPLFDQIHCYLNIPDTSGRDSLFQAEARRCKEILDAIDLRPDDMHLCVFDELYSGTNPEEATASSTAFMRFLAKHSTVRSVLTTHFVGVCTELSKEPQAIQNFRMETTTTPTGKIGFTYKLSPGISTVKGGMHILEQMCYPEELVRDSFKEMKKKANLSTDQNVAR